jgi:hypothetical protein
MQGSADQRRGQLATPRRNKFFHGKMMDVYQFELETAYEIGLRRLSNRLVTGFGVVCGLDVVEGNKPLSIKVGPGLAIDGWGREIVVPGGSASVPIPPPLVEEVCQDEESAVTVVIDYHECESEPVPVLAGDCETAPACTPGVISEKYRISFVAGAQEPVLVRCRLPDVLEGSHLDYRALARWVTDEIPRLPQHPGVPLANIRLDCDGDCKIEDVTISDIDIEVRRVVLSNRFVLDLLAAIVAEDQHRGHDWRQEG